MSKKKKKKKEHDNSQDRVTKSTTATVIRLVPTSPGLHHPRDITLSLGIRLSWTANLELSSVLIRLAQITESGCLLVYSSHKGKKCNAEKKGVLL